MLRAFTLSLALTLVFELGFALVWGLRRRDLMLCALVNVLTNPVVVLLHFLFPHPAATVLWELGAITVEGWYYQHCGHRVRRPLLFSLLCNLFSFCLGLMINPLL